MKRTWESVKEDSEGNIMTINNDQERSKRAKLQRLTQSVRRGLIRYMMVFLDCSVSAKDTDYRPSRLEVMKSTAQKFVLEYFDQNPISQLSVAVTRDRIAEKLTDLSGNSKSHIQAIGGLLRTEGSASLQNVLLLAMATLRDIPDYGCREIVIVYSSLATCDPGDIFKVIEEVRKMKIRCNVICLSAEIYICRKLAELTKGTFTLALDTLHLNELLLRHTTPPPEAKSSSSQFTDFVYMGFPSRHFDPVPLFAFEARRVTVASTSYVCPRCGARVTEIPSQCAVCSLQLNSSSHIARSHHHLFPVDNFTECTKNLETKTANSASCYGCLFRFTSDSMRMKCPKCTNLFCVECDIFIHDSLHNCPGCSTNLT